MPNTPPPPQPNPLDDIQGDIWSKGFPKYYETYYFFSIKPGESNTNAKLFAQCLKDLVVPSRRLISTLRMARADQDRITAQKTEAAAEAKRRGIPEKEVTLPKIPMSNALIAFTFKGLKAVSHRIKGCPPSNAKLPQIQAGLQDTDSLKLPDVKDTDPAFYKGMADNKDMLHDPDLDTWDPLFQSTEIHGMLKIGGSSKEKVEEHLKKIQVVLKYDTVIVDAFQKSPSTPTDSRVDGWTRPNHRGKEQ
jgi:hypothetical protein